MEIRRIEGVFLQVLGEQAQGISAQRKTEELRIRLVSVVPEVLLESLKGKETLRATVMDTSGGRGRLLLDNGYEILAENRMSVSLQRGDRLELRLEENNPAVLRLERLEGVLKGEGILKSLLEGQSPLTYSPLNLKESLFSSGIFYERRLYDFITGKLSLQELLSDTKAQLLQEVGRWVKLEGLTNTELLSYLRNLLREASYTGEVAQKVMSLLEVLTLKNLTHGEYAQLVRYLGSLSDEGARELLLALERKDQNTMVQRLLDMLKVDENLPYRDKFMGAVQELVRMEAQTSDQSLKSLLREFVQTHRGAQELMSYARELLNSPLVRAVEDLHSLTTKLEYIIFAQHNLISKGRVFLPVEDGGGRGGLLLEAKEDYRIIAHLNYPGYYVSVIITAPKRERVEFLRVAMFTDDETLANLLMSSKGQLEALLSEEGLRLSAFSVDLRTKEENLSHLLEELGEEGFHLVV